MAGDKNAFVWEDPFLFEDQLSEDERMMRDAAATFAADKLAPRIEQAYLNETAEMCIRDSLKKARDLLVAAKPNWVAMEYSAIDKMKAGDFQASTTWNGAGLRIRLARPEVHFGYPKEGFTYWSDNVVVLKDAKNVENAKLFQNFIMDPQIAAGLSAYHRYANGIAGSEKFMPAEMKDAPEIVIPEASKPHGTMAMMCAAETDAIYTKIWTELQK